MGMGKEARRIRRITSNQTIPADTHIPTHNPPKMCGGYKKGASLPFVDKTRITNQCEQTTCPPVCGGGRLMRENTMSDYEERIRQAEERVRKRMITLRQLLQAMKPEEPLPDEWDSVDDFRPQSVFKINLCFMSEEETWIEAYWEHVILIPWYDCKVVGFNADEKFTLNVWLDYEDFLEKKRETT